MGIVHLKKRVTTDLNQYKNYANSSDSLIYAKDTYKNDTCKMDQSGPDCLTFTVGTCWYDSARYLKIDPRRGIKVKPQTSIVIETAEEIVLPHNIYGLLFGAGSNIYRGAFISSGKIDPGYAGKLRIGFFNGSNRTVILNSGDKLAYGIFIGTECDTNNIPFLGTGSPPAASIMGIKERIWRWFARNAYQVLAIVFAVISIIIAICKK